MKIIATHVTEQGTVLGIANRQRHGQHGLLVLPPHTTLGGCFWGLVQGIEHAGQHLINDFARGVPNIGRAPNSPHTLWIEVDLPNPNYVNFDPERLSLIQAACLLGVPPHGAPSPNCSVYSELKFQTAGDRIAPMSLAHSAIFNALWAGVMGNQAMLTNALAQWLRSPGRTTANLPPAIHPALGLTGGSRNRVFQPPNLRSAEHCLWEAVGRQCCALNNVGMVIVPQGCYVTRTGGGRFVVIPNALVQTHVRLRPSTVPWL